MKKVMSEFSLTVTVIIAIVAVLGIVLFITENSEAYILNSFLQFFSEEKERKSVSDSFIVMKNRVQMNDEIELGYVSNTMKNLFSNSVALDESFQDIDENVIQKLSNLTTKNIEKISEDGKIKCSNSCEDLELFQSEKIDDYQYQYYQVNDYYVVSVSSDDSSYQHSFVYEHKNNILNLDTYTLSSVQSDDITVQEQRVASKESNEQSSNFSVDFEYDTSYLSMATVSKKTKSFKNDSSLVEQIYQENIGSVVVLNTYSEEVIVETATGFVISSDIVVTSAHYIIESLKNGNFITALTNSSESYDILGIVMIDEESDIALLKMESTDLKKVTFAENIHEGDEVLLLGTFGEFGISGQIGVNLSNTYFQTNSLYTVSNNIGSPLFNSDGKVVGMVTSHSNFHNLSNSTSAVIIKKYLSLVEKNSNSNLCYSLKDLAEKFYLSDFKEEKVVDTITKSVWDEYKSIGDIENTIFVEKVKAIELEDKITLRYRNDTGLSNDDIIQDFLDTLLKEGYQEKLNSSKKKKYVGSHYQIVIYYEFDYIIISMEKV